MIDGRIPCPQCGAQADLTTDTLSMWVGNFKTMTVVSEQDVEIWECPACGERFARLEGKEDYTMPGDKKGHPDPNNPSDKPTNLPKEFEKPTDTGDKGTSGVPGTRTTIQK